jgi:hypothetical protein
MAAADVHAAGKAEGAVDDEDFAVAAEVGIVKAAGDESGQEGSEGDFVPLQGPADRGKGVADADVVDEDADGHAALVSGGEGFDESLADRVVVEDVGLQGDGGLSGVDGGEHFVVGLAAGGERRDLIAGLERQVGEAGDVFDEGSQVQRVVAEGLM